MPANIHRAIQFPLSPTGSLAKSKTSPSSPSLSPSSYQGRQQLKNELLWRNRHHRQQQQQLSPAHLQKRSSSRRDLRIRIKQRPVSTRAVLWLACLYATFYIAGVHVIKRADLILGPELFASLLGVTHEHLLNQQHASLESEQDVEPFVLSEHLPAIDEPFITRLGNICPSAPWQQRATSSLPVSCQAELSDLLYAYHVALNKGRASILQCTLPSKNNQMHAIVRLERAAPALERYEKRVGELANLISYEGAWRSRMPDDGVLLRIIQIIGLDSGGSNVVNILSPITLSSFGRSSSSVWLARDCGWVGRIVVLSAAHTTSPSPQVQDSLTSSYEYSFTEFRANIKKSLGMESKVDKHSFEFEDEGREEGLEVLTVNLGTRNDFHVLAQVLRSVVPQIVSVRFSFAAGDVLDVVATPQWDDEEEQQPSDIRENADSYVKEIFRSSNKLDWDGTCVMSASIRAFEVLATRYGYQVVHVTSTHVYMMHKLIWQQHASLGLAVERSSVRSMYRRQTVISNFGGFSAPAVQETISECTKRW